MAMLGWTAVPVKLTDCGLLEVLSMIMSEPVLVPVAVGVKVTETVQLAPAFMLVPQEFV